MSGEAPRNAQAALPLETIVALALWGSVPVVIRYVSANPFAIGIVRLIAASILIRLLFVGPGGLRNLSRRDGWGLLAIGLCFGLHWVLYFFSIKLSSASLGAIGLSAYGICLVLLSALFEGSRLKAIDLLALALCIVGSLLLAPGSGMFESSTVAIGLLCSVGSAFCFACLPILHRRFRHLGPGVRTFGQFFFALPLFLPGLPWAGLEALSANDWMWLGYLTIFGTIIGHGLWIRVSTALHPTTTSTVYYIYLPVALGFSYLFLGERLDPSMLAGAVLIVSGSILGVRNQQPQSISEATRSPDSTAPSK